MVSPDRLIYQRASRPSLYKDLILFCWLTGSENNSLYVYKKKVSDPMLMQLQVQCLHGQEHSGESLRALASCMFCSWPYIYTCLCMHVHLEHAKLENTAVFERNVKWFYNHNVQCMHTAWPWQQWGCCRLAAARPGRVCQQRLLEEGMTTHPSHAHSMSRYTSSPHTEHKDHPCR